MSIRLIVGLGNPGPEYEQTRHNAGFWLVDNLANSLPGCRLQRESRFNAMVAKTRIAGNEVWLLEPLTYMNRSGQSVGALARFYKINPDEVLVVHDELDLPPEEPPFLSLATPGSRSSSSCTTRTSSGSIL